MSNDTIAQRKAHAIERLTNDRDSAINRAEAAEARAADLLETITALQADFDAMKAAFEECTTHCLEALAERDKLRTAFLGQIKTIKGFQRMLDQALNEGAGAYRP